MPSASLQPDLLQALNEHAIVSVADLQGTIVYANDRFCQISGYRREELIGQSHRLLKSGHHEPAFYEAMWRTIASGQVWHGELTNRRKDGSLYWVQSTIVPVLDEQGLPQRYVSLRTDISCQKQLEREARGHAEFLRRITETFGLGVLVADAKGRCQFASGEALRMLGMPREQVEGWSIHGLFTELSKDAAALRPGKAEARGQLWRPGRYHGNIPRNDSKATPVVIHVSALRENGQRSGTVIHFRDDSEERRAIASAQRERRLAEKADQAKATFMAQLSHEIRTPLAGILGLVRMARAEAQASPRMLEMLGRIEHSADTLAQLVGEVLDMSRIEAGQFTLTEAPFDLPALVRSVWEAHVMPAAHQRIRLEMVLAPDLPAHVLGDAMRVRQILVNYVANAVKFTSDGQVTLRALRGASSGIRLEVSDTGIGIAPQVLKRLFRPFSQADATTAARYGGTGLGLSICKQLARQMGGTVGASSTAEQGSTFWAELPLPAVDLPQPAPAQPAPQALPPLHLRVLLAEDDEVNVLIATAMLEAWQCSVVAVNNGREVLETLDTDDQAFDVVLLDLHMPVMGGREAAERIRRRDSTRHLPIIGLTAVGLAQERQLCLKAGMDDFLTKPVAPAALHAALVRATAGG
ncbi:PAS domain S-box protein [Ideonella sp. 4Y11]|uniref:Virulence sensor protein BvgS n=1 Tax=Ideonella aquatica TaxID=2824119 RepID=A0A940YHZ3_9BURK|nr:PAS domain S-box protein [Ideonella aquatica]MBQ0958159.1 PAS domain S-box protein [Ideonella aquatica]